MCQRGNAPGRVDALEDFRGRRREPRHEGASPARQPVIECLAGALHIARVHHCSRDPRPAGSLATILEAGFQDGVGVLGTDAGQLQQLGRDLVRPPHDPRDRADGRDEQLPLARMECSQ